MKCNVGTADRVIRVLLGLFLISLVFWGPKTVWGWVGVVPLLTGVFAFCPVYLPFGLSTGKCCGSSCGTEPKKDEPKQ